MYNWKELTVLPQIVLAVAIPIVCLYLFGDDDGGLEESDSDATDWFYLGYGARLLYTVLGWLIACFAVYSLQGRPNKMQARRVPSPDSFESDDESPMPERKRVEHPLRREKANGELVEVEADAKMDDTDWAELLEDLKRENAMFRKRFEGLNPELDPETDPEATVRRAQEMENAPKKLESAQQEILCLKENLKELQRERAAAVETVRRVVARRPEFRGAYGDLHVNVPTRLGPDQYPESIFRHVLDRFPLEIPSGDTNSEVCRAITEEEVEVHEPVCL